MSSRRSRSNARQNTLNAVNSHIALMRFGLGPKPGGVGRILSLTPSRNPALDACLAELNNPSAALLTDASLPTLEQCGLLGMHQNMPGDRPVDALFTQERVARFAKYTEPEVGFVERLVLFWSNHFSLAPVSDLVRGVMGHAEREVIRRHVLGKFSDMLKGVIAHPAMIRRLNNQNSIGPNSVEGLRTRRGLNENLGREILELYTVGANGGYTQADVTSMALILTGWSIQGNRDLPQAGLFRFNADGHEPGTFTVMGTSFGQPGQQKGFAALDMLASHERTAEHIAFKLILHFITDTPSAKSVRSLARVFRRSGGDLRVVSEALLTLPEAWSEPMTRIRQPLEWMVSMARAVGFDQSKGELMFQRFNNWGWLSALNYPYWNCPTPDGHPDQNFFWVTPNAIRQRRDAAFAFCQRFLQIDEPRSDTAKYWRTNRPALTNPAQFAQDLLPGVLPPATLAELANFNPADDTQVLSNLALVFMTPEYLNR